MVKRRRSLGHGFSDELNKVTSKSFKQVQEFEWKDALIPNFQEDFLSINSKKSVWRVVVFFTITIILFFVLYLRLFHLTIINGQRNRELAEGNRIAVKVIHAPRGVIYDRNGKILSANSPGFRLVTKLKDGTLEATIISRETALEMEVKQDEKFKDLEVDSIRHYPFGEVLAHVIGYVGEISPEQLESLKQKKYQAGDRIGQSGIESYYEDILRGKDGGEIIEVDSRGNKLRTLRTIDPVPGQNIYLTIDSDLQKHTFALLSETVKKTNSCCAVAVAADPSTGQILALISYPSFNNNFFSNQQEEGQIAEVLSNPNSPILNRVIAGTYPPGSTFKIVSSLAALSSGKITQDTIYEDTGEMYLGPFRFTNWYFTQYGRVEGSVNLVKALKRSNDIYFYRVGQTVGEDALIEWSRKIKLGDKLGIDLPGEIEGLVPDNAWKEKNFGEPWYPGDTLHLSIGQGFLLTTPIQVLGMTSFIAAGGELYKPKLLLKTEQSQFKPELLVSKLTSSEQLKVIHQGLVEVSKDGGTAWPFFTFPIPTAGKTGTAEFGDPKDKTHAWYVGYAPADDPKIVMTVLIEGGGEGSSVASPIVKEAFRWYLSPDKNNLIKDSYQASDSAKILGE